MASTRSLNVFVSIGARLGSSFGSTISAAESRFARMGRRISVAGAEMNIAMRRFNAASAGMGGLISGVGTGLAFKAMIGEGVEYNHQLENLRLAGKTTTEVAQAVAAAHKTMANVRTSTLTDNLKLIGETTLAYGSLAHATENLSFNAKMGTLLKLRLGENFNEAESFNQIVRSLELRGGKLSSRDYQRQADGLFRAFSVSGGTVNPENLLGFMQQAGPAARGMSERFLTSIVPTLVQEFGGDRAGTAFAALYNQMQGRTGVGGKSITQEWIRLGLVPRRGTGGNLSATGWTPGSLVGNRLAMSDPLAWMQTYLFPALRAHGIDTNNAEAMRTQAQKMWGRETGKRLADTLFSPAQLARIRSDATQFSSAPGVDAAYRDAAKRDPRFGMLAFHSSLKNLGTSLGTTLAMPAARALNAIAGGITRIAETFDKHPGLAKGVVAIGAGLMAMVGLSVVGRAFEFVSAGFGLFSTAAGGLLKFLPGLTQSLSATRFLMVAARAGFMEAALSAGAFLLPVVAIGAALAVVVAKWNGIKAFFKGFGEGFSKALSPETRSAMTRLGNAISGTFSAIGKALTPVVDRLQWLFGAFFNKADEGKWAKWGEGFGKAIGSVANSLAWLIGKLAEGMEAMSRFWASVAAGPKGLAPVANPPHRMLGGSVHAGKVYEVGERGPELFAPGRSGTIIPAGMLANARRAQPAVANYTFAPHIEVSGAMDADDVARLMDQRFRRFASEARAALHD